MLLIGSHALGIQATHLLRRKPLDHDFIGTYDEVMAFIRRNRPLFKEIYPAAGGNKMIARGHDVICEFEIAWSDSNAAAIMSAAAADVNTKHARILDTDVAVASLDLLFLLKKSHRFLKNSPHFNKTMADYRALRAAGAEVRPEWAELYKRREKDTYNYKHPKLDVKKDDFFKDDNIKYVFDHDTIHESMKHLDRPAYTYFKRPGSEVMCDRGLFEAAPEQVKLFSVVEETQVLALERSQVPFPGVWTPRRSFDFALMKVCSSITSGWWREYAYENYHDVVALYEPDYVDRFWRAVDQGIVKRLPEGHVNAMGMKG